MKSYFKSFYPNLEEQLTFPSFKKTREEVWEQLHAWKLPLSYHYFLTHTAGQFPKAPSFDLARVLPGQAMYKEFYYMTIQNFWSREEVETWYLEQEKKQTVLEWQYCPIATLKEGGEVLIGLNKISTLSGGIFYKSPQYGMVKLAENLLAFLKECTKLTTWSMADLIRIARSNAIEQGQIKMSNLRADQATKPYQEVVLLQEYQGQVEYLLTRSSIVIFGEETREYWLEELKAVEVDKMAYMQLAIKQSQQLEMRLDFGPTQEEINLYDIQEQRAIQKLLGFIMSHNNKKAYW